MIKNIIFDIGNVILKFNRDTLLRHFYNGDEFEFLKEKLFYEWEKLDEDLVSLQEYKDNVLSSIPKHLHNFATGVLDNWEYFVRYTEGIIDFIYSLKKRGYKLYILSNMTRHFIERDYKFPILKEFDGIVYSAPIKMVKPDPKIYEYILHKFSLNPSECLFIDDTKKNLVEATRFGIKTFHFENNLSKLKEFILTL